MASSVTSTSAPSPKERSAQPFDRSALEQTLTKRFFYAPSFSLYGGVAGLYDYGPPGTALQTNILSQWRQHFVLEEDMLELDCTIMTPAEVLRTSGHVEKFSDFMCKDLKTGEIFRADHLVEAVLEARLAGDKQARDAEAGATPSGADALTKSSEEDAKSKKKKKKGKVVAVKLDESIKAEYSTTLAQIDNYNGNELGEIIRKFEIKAPETGNEVSPPVEFNLMFDSSIGPTGHLKGYLRPETAQGQFLNFKRLLEFNNDRMPFASAQIGKSFRNEISPRSGLLRVREFTMAEIEHFVDPDNKAHPGFARVRDTKLRLLSASTQLEGKTDITEMSIGEAVDQGIVDNETLGYFLARIHQFLIKIGINGARLRFRQHMQNEMAHYACDCWDAEIHTSYGWIECVGCADRSAYDLTVHAARTKEKLVVREALPEPRVVDRTVVEVNKKVFGPRLKKSAKVVEDALMGMSETELEALRSSLEQAGQGEGVEVKGTDGEGYKVDGEMLTVKRVTVTEHVREYTPNVIEPSFGIGRILYALLEHVWWVRPGSEARGVLSFPIAVAPVKCLVQPLSNHPSFTPLVREMSSLLRASGIPAKVDTSSASVGKAYARNDELGTSLAVTVDFQSVKDRTVTLRERDSTEQVRESVEEVIKILGSLVRGEKEWSDIRAQYPLFTQQVTE
ncbi:MAG: glycyl-tRNA synthetase [Piptocephalis tieghemiana]|nr:MAG: glycyl-tRNA synthetase [Piptocephalis tieghemiana]